MSKSKKTLLIIGGSSGIGLKVAEIFLKEDHQVILVGKDESKLSQAIHRLNRLGNIEGYALDICSAEGLDNLFKVLDAIDLPHSLSLLGGETKRDGCEP